MNNKTIRTWMTILAALFTLSFLFAACGKSGETPLDNLNTHGLTDSSTDEPVTKTPDNGSASDGTSPTETPDESNPPDTSTPEVNKAAEYEAGGYYEEMKASIDDELINIQETMKIILGIEFDIECTLNDIEQKYGEYLSVNITSDAVKIGIYKSAGPYYKARFVNMTGISPNALKDVNDFLESKGEAPLDSAIPEQNIAALWIAASLYYDPNVENGDPAYDIALPFGLVRADKSIPGSVEEQAEKFQNSYITLFNLREETLFY